MRVAAETKRRWNRESVDKTETIEITDVAYLRRIAYELLGLLFLYPSYERERAAAELAKELKCHPRFSVAFPFFIGWEYFLDQIEALGRNGRGFLEEEYGALFMGNAEASPCLPFESAYRDSGPEGIAWTAAELEREYADAGFVLSSEIEEISDHVSVELGFMSQLCEEEKRAWEGRSAEEGFRLLRREANFLQRHLNPWLPVFERAMTKKDHMSRYALFAGVAVSFIAFDFERIKLVLEMVEKGSEEKSRPRGVKTRGEQTR